MRCSCDAHEALAVAQQGPCRDAEGEVSEPGAQGAVGEPLGLGDVIEGLQTSRFAFIDEDLCGPVAT